MSCSNVQHLQVKEFSPAHRFLHDSQAQPRDDESSVWLEVTLVNMHRQADATGYLRARQMLEEEEAGEELRTTSWLQGIVFAWSLSSCLAPLPMSPDWAQPCLLGESDASAIQPCMPNMPTISMLGRAVCCAAALNPAVVMLDAVRVP